MNANRMEGIIPRVDSMVDMDISPMIIPLSMVTTIVWLATC